MFATLHAGIGVKQTHSSARSLKKINAIDFLLDPKSIETL